MAVVAEDEVATHFASIARGTHTQHGATDVHITGIGRFGAGGVVACAVDIHVGVAFNGFIAEVLTIEITEVGSRIHCAVDEQCSCVVTHVFGRSGIGGIVDGVVANEGIYRAVGMTEVTAGEHVVIDVAAADVHMTEVFTHVIAGLGKGQGIIGITRSAIHIGI